MKNRALQKGILIGVSLMLIIVVVLIVLVPNKVADSLESGNEQIMKRFSMTATIIVKSSENGVIKRTITSKTEIEEIITRVSYLHQNRIAYANFHGPDPIFNLEMIDSDGKIIDIIQINNHHGTVSFESYGIVHSGQYELDKIHMEALIKIIER